MESASSCKPLLQNYESYLRKCLESQTIDYLLSKPACFNLLAVGEDCLGKVTLLETLLGVRATALREAKARAGADPAREFSVQIVSETLSLGNNCCALSQTGDTPAVVAANASSSSISLEEARPLQQQRQQMMTLVGGSGQLTVRLMTTVNYSFSEGGRNPWSSVADFLAKQVTTYVNSRAASPFDFRPEDDERVHCCLYFLPPFGARGLRRCDAQALKCLEDKVNLVPVLAKADCYTAEELAERKSAVAADLQRHGISVHQFLLPVHQHLQQQNQQTLQLGQRLLAAPMAVIGAPHPEYTRCLPWGSVSVEDERFSDVPALRNLIVEKNMLILRKTTKKFHASIQKAKMAATIPRK